MLDSLSQLSAQDARGAARSKTMGFAAALAAFGAVQVYLPALKDFISPAAYGWITVGVAIAVAVLRVVTTKPLSKK